MSEGAVAATVIPEGFALFEGGPFLKVLRRVPALRPMTDVLWGRVLVAVGVTWLPLLVLSIIAGVALHGPALPFLKDVQTQGRMLVSLPLYIIAAHQAQVVITPALTEFVKHGLVRERDRERFTHILQAASRWNHSAALRLAIVGLVLVLGPEMWVRALASRGSSAWYGDASIAHASRTAAGFWFLWIANPIFQYLHVLWMARFLMFGAMLARIAALDLHLVATHPDRAGGLGFLGVAGSAAFVALIAAEGAAAAGVLANRIFHEGRPLTLFKMDILIAAVAVAAVVLGPMCVFLPKLLATKRLGYRQYSRVASRYVREFEDVWVRNDASAAGRVLLGSSDVQSLADMSNSFQVVERMRFVPFGSMAAIGVFVVFLLPIAPLLLTVIPVDELLRKLVGIFLG